MGKYRSVFSKNEMHIEDNNISNIIDELYASVLAGRANKVVKDTLPYKDKFNLYCTAFLDKGVAQKVSKIMIKNIKRLIKIYYEVNESTSIKIFDSIIYKRCVNKLGRLEESNKPDIDESSIKILKKSEFLLFEEKEMCSIRYMEMDDDILEYDENDISYMKYYSDRKTYDFKEGSFEYFLQLFDYRDKLSIFISYKPKGLPVLARIKNNKIKNLIYLTGKQIIEIHPSVMESKVTLNNIPDCVIKFYIVLPFKHLDAVSNYMDKKYKNPSVAIQDIFVRNSEERKIFYQYIQFIPYDICIDNQDYFDSSRKEKLDILKSIECKYPLKTFVLQEPVDKLLIKFENMIDFLVEERYDLPYEVEGVIVEPSKKKIIEKLNIKNDIYQFRMFYKLPSAMKETIVRDMKTTVGHTGKINNVIYYDEVKFEGRPFDHSAIGSASVFERLRLKKGDRIKVFYSNDRLATIFMNVDRDNDGKYIKFPDKCPRCGSGLKEKGSNFYCNNKECPEIKIRKLTNFVNRLNISYLSYSGIETLYKLGVIKDYTDLFKMDSFRIAEIPNFTMKKVGRIKEELDILKNRKVSQEELLYALSIDNLGPKAASIICGSFNIRDLLYRDNYDFITDALPSLKNYKIGFKYIGRNSKEIEKIIDMLL